MNHQLFQIDETVNVNGDLFRGKTTFNFALKTIHKHVRLQEGLLCFTHM